jgi:hypothetical protein
VDPVDAMLSSFVQYIIKSIPISGLLIRYQPCKGMAAT